MMSGWTPIGDQIDNLLYDFLLRQNPPAPIATQAVIAAIDDATLTSMGGPRRMRSILSEALERIAAAQPQVVALDVILHDPGDPHEDARLSRAIAANRNIILPTNLDGGRWEDPEPAFIPQGALLGHIKADETSRDGVTRAIPLEKSAGRKRRWAMALEAFRIAKGAKFILESPNDIQVGDEVIPARYAQDRLLRIFYSAELVPEIPVIGLIHDPALAAQLKEKVVFLGVTSISSSGDRITTPIAGGHPIPGVEVHGQVFETLERRKFLTDARISTVVTVCALVAVIAGCMFAWLAGWPAYVAGIALLAAAHSAPFLLFRYGIVFPYFGPLATAWLTVAGAATYQSLVVRRQLWKSEIERARYRQAIHFVTHEMRSPLTAIQGSSELMGRYNLSEEKRKQIVTMINSESKRLARMIQTFLDVERLADGQMELHREPVGLRDVVEGCMERVRPLADRKSIRMRIEEPLGGELFGDRELMEYAIYNLLTNGVKYSPAETEIVISSRPDAGFLRLSIKDEGMGMDARELKQIFTRFYRTKRAEASGEAGTGIGLSIVDQIVTYHGGRIEVTSAPGKGSCFTVVLPARVAATEGRGVAR